MKIITIGREFGSGGRELGKRLADLLGVPCYDKEIIAEVAKMQDISPEQVEHITTSEIHRVYPTTIGGTLGAPLYCHHNAIHVLGAQQNVIRKLADQGDCVIVGRQADVILKDYKPLNIFVYADRQSKLKRCMERAASGESEREILKRMKKIDRARASNRRIISDQAWGRKEAYHICVNTSNIEIKDLASVLAEYVRAWFADKE